MSKMLNGSSPVTCMNGCAASSQCLASSVGVDVLKAGGNAADASVAMVAVLNVVEPYSTGLGGDTFCLYYDAAHKKVHAMNASGRSPAKLTRELINNAGFDEETGFPCHHGFAVTVPGAASGWIDCVQKYGSGKMTMRDILQPAIDLARNGFPVAGPVTAEQWKVFGDVLPRVSEARGRDLLKADSENTFRAPNHGEILKNPKLANVFEQLAEKGKDGFYRGWVADSVVDSVRLHGGVMEKSDLENMETTFEDPLSIDYKGFTVWETAPNSQGIVVLLALNILKNFDLSQYDSESPEYWHIVIEAMKLAFADGNAYCADPSKVSVPISGLLSPEYGSERAKLIDMNSATSHPQKGLPQNYGSDTVYFTVVDKDRNACSFISSIYEAFGSGIVPNGCGFALQNRGANFSLRHDHPNVAAPSKRPYHTIIPGMVTDSRTGELVMSFGVMGGFMQPQGHVQVLLNCVEFGMNPQQALDRPRFRISEVGGSTLVQADMPSSVINSLKSKGHDLELVGSIMKYKFGIGQAIATTRFWEGTTDRNGEVLYGGTDRRHDGIAIGY